MHVSFLGKKGGLLISERNSTDPVLVGFLVFVLRTAWNYQLIMGLDGKRVH